jgi:penicillin amidase
LISPPSAAAAWATLTTAAELPAEFDPTTGFVVSANERPPPADVLVGWFFSPDDRVLRLTKLVEKAGLIGRNDLMRLLQDVGARNAQLLRDRLLSGRQHERDASPLLSALASWDGRYDTESAGALALELVLNRLARKIIPPVRQTVYGGVWTTRGLVASRLCLLKF